MDLGIDFGTTRTVVAGARSGRYPLACFDIDGRFQDHLPGFAAQGPDGLEFGEGAWARIRSGRWPCVSSVKRAITGLAPDDPVEGLESVSALELATRYLTWVREMLVSHGNLELDRGEPVRAMIAVPANAGTHQRFVTLEAFRRAGFEVRAMLNEPTAAAIEFAQRNGNVLAKRSPKQYLVVYDLGGGTFDTASVLLRGHRFELMASDGITRLGGADFDEALLSLAASEAGISLESRTNAERTALLETCREAKEALGPHHRKLLLDFADVDTELPSVTLDVAHYYAACAPLVTRTLAPIERMLEALTDSGIDVENPRQLAAVYLVGGASALPAVARRLRERFGRRLQLAPQPHAATAVGLAVAIDADAGVYVREATTRHFGVWREAHDGHDKVFDRLLAKDQLASTEASTLAISRSYRPVHRIGRLRYVECSELDEAGQPTGDLLPWKEILFPYDPTLASVSDAELDDSEHVDLARDTAALRGQPRDSGHGRHPLDEEIVETYRYAADGSIEVVIENRTHGYQRSFVLGAAG